jgi:hypothetical protein
MAKHWSELDHRQLHYSVGPARGARGKFPYRHHRSMEQVMIDEGDPHLLERIRSDAEVARRWETQRKVQHSQFDRRVRRRALDIKGLCRDCEGNSPQWITGVCHSCGNTGVAREGPQF